MASHGRRRELTIRKRCSSLSVELMCASGSENPRTGSCSVRCCPIPAPAIGDRRPSGWRPGESCAGKRHPARRTRRCLCRLARQPIRRDSCRLRRLVRRARFDHVGDRQDSKAELSIDDMIDRLLRMVAAGLRKARCRDGKPDRCAR
jgi:hypothetical protein